MKYSKLEGELGEDVKEEIVKSREEEDGTDYSDDYWRYGQNYDNDADVVEDIPAQDESDNTRKTFYQSHIFPMHMLTSLKVCFHIT